MTATLAPLPVTGGDPIWAIGAPRLLAGLDRTDTLDLRNLLALLDAARLTGRGGAAFPFAAKVRAVAPGKRTVVVNGSESEPASHKDRTLLRRAPHLVLDGALTVAAALDAARVVVVVADQPAATAVRRGSTQTMRGGSSPRVRSRTRAHSTVWVSGMLWP